MTCPINTEFVKALRTGRTNHLDLVWRERISGRGHGAMTRENERAAANMAAKEEALARAVSRDPCWLCGTRGDLECEHS